MHGNPEDRTVNGKVLMEVAAKLKKADKVSKKVRGWPNDEAQSPLLDKYRPYACITRRDYTPRQACTWSGPMVMLCVLVRMMTILISRPASMPQ